MSKATYLLDVNVLYALLAEDHVHHRLVSKWFGTTGLQWAVCPFTEAGFLRNATASRPGQISMSAANAVLERLRKHPGYRSLPAAADWHSLCGPFFKRLYGAKQITDAFLLGIAVRAGAVLVTMDKGILHLAGDEYGKHVLLLKEN